MCLGKLLLVFVAQVATSWGAPVELSTTLFVSNETDGLVCDGEFSAPCSALKTATLVDGIKLALEAAPDLPALETTLNEVSDNLHDEPDAVNFEVFVLNATTFQCLAYNGEGAYVGLNLDEILDTAARIVQSDVGQHLLESATSSDPWMELLWPASFITSEGEAIPCLIFTQTATLFDSQQVIVFSGFAMHPLPHIKSCDFEYNGHCTVQNVRSLVGEALTEILRASTPEQLHTVFNSLSFDQRYKEGPLGTFVYMFGNETQGQALADGNARNVRLNRTEIVAANQALWTDDQEALHAEMSELASSGGGWISFNESFGENVFLRSACIIGVEKFGQAMYLGAAMWHRKLPKKYGPGCAVCSSKILLPCAMQNAESLVAHMEVEELITNIDFATSVSKIQTSDDFLQEGGFHIALYEDDGTCIANSLNSSHIHHTFQENYSLNSDDVFQVLLHTGNNGGGWVNYTIGNQQMLAFVVKIAKQGHEIVAFSPIEVNLSPTKSHCTAEYNAPCAEEDASAIIGQAKFDMSVAMTGERLNDIFSAITANEERYTSGIDFHLIIMEYDGTIQAYGGDPEAVGKNIVQLLVEKDINTIAAEFVENLVDVAFRGRGGVHDFFFNEQPMKALVESVETQNRAFVIMSFFKNAAEHPECGSHGATCPRNAFCASDEFCLCGTYFVAEFVDVTDFDSCGTNATRHFKMQCVPNPDFDNLLAVKNLCRGAFAFIVSIVLASFLVIWKKRKHPIIRASQPKFLVLFTVGVLISSSSILFITTDDYFGVAAGLDGQNHRANMACNLTVYFYGIGFVLQYSSLFAKLRRVRVLFVNDKMKKNLVLTNKDLFRQILTFLSIEIFLISLWVGTEPLIFARARENWHSDESGCYSSSSDFWIGLIAMYHLSLLIYGNFTAFKARKVNGVFAETKFITIAMLSIFEILCLSIPLIILSSSHETTQVFIRSGVVFFSDLSSIGLIFFPKFLCIINPHALDTSGTGGNILSEELSKNSKTKKTSTSAAGPVGTIVRSTEAAVHPM